MQKDSEKKFLEVLNEKKEKAKAYLEDDGKMEKLFRDFEKKLKMVPKVGEYLSDIPVMCSMIRAYRKKQYTDISRGTIFISIALIIYVVSQLI